MSAMTSHEAIAEVCNSQHYYQAGQTSTGTKYWMCIRCAHLKPFVPAQRSGE